MPTSSHPNMTLYYLLLLTLADLIRAAVTYQNPLLLSVFDTQPGPSVDNAIKNAPQIFNTIHGALRQWGSSLKHNGMSYFLVTIQEGTLLYHANISDVPLDGMQWLAFEVEHAEIFTGSAPLNPGGKPGPFYDIDNQNVTGYLYTYRTTRPLRNVLYIDGLSAAKSKMGTLDTQDRVLLKDSNFREIPGFEDYNRAQALCKLSPNLEGILRTELGFELIKCKVDAGTQLLSMTTRKEKWAHGREEQDILWSGELSRGVSKGYQGIEAGRALIDYSSMVSAYFYPFNLTNPDIAKAPLPRIHSDEEKLIESLKRDVMILIDGSERSQEKIDWQKIVDPIINRYSDRLAYMESSRSNRLDMLYEMNFLLERFYNHTTQDMAIAQELCTLNFLFPAEKLRETLADHFIYEAISTVTGKICRDLFEARHILMTRLDDRVVSDVKLLIGDLMHWLDWSTWLECGKCELDEVCTVAIWPWGSQEDHDHPSCINIKKSWTRRGYWDFQL